MNKVSGHSRKIAEFRQVCAEQSVELSPVVQATIDNNTLHRAVEVASYQKTNGKNDQLAKRPIEDDDIFSTNTAARALRYIINGSITKTTDTSLLHFSSDYNSLLDSDACSYAEFAIAKSLQYNEIPKKDIKPEHANAMGVSTVYLQDGLPVFFKKGLGVQTLLSLTDIAIDGIRYIPGSVIAGNIEPESDKSTHIIDHNLQAVTSFIMPDSEFVRLSVFAYPPEERRYFRRMERFLRDDDPTTKSIIALSTVQSIADYFTDRSANISTAKA